MPGARRQMSDIRHRILDDEYRILKFIVKTLVEARKNYYIGGCADNN
jgi:hypothetical protein